MTNATISMDVRRIIPTGVVQVCVFFQNRKNPQGNRGHCESVWAEVAGKSVRDWAATLRRSGYTVTIVRVK